MSVLFIELNFIHLTVKTFTNTKEKQVTNHISIQISQQINEYIL